MREAEAHQRLVKVALMLAPLPPGLQVPRGRRRHDGGDLTTEPRRATKVNQPLVGAGGGW